jgi:uncharacterized protein
LIGFKMKKIGIIGSGPAGIFSALELSKYNFEITIFEKEPYSSGGMINDCKLNLSHKIGMELDDLKISSIEADKLISYVDNLFLEHGASDKIYGLNEIEIKRLQEKANLCGLELISAKQRHIGTDNSKQLVNKFKDTLNKRNVQIKTKTLVKDIIKKQNGSMGLIFSREGIDDFLEFDYLISSPGRAGSTWFREKADKLGINYTWGPIDVGVRIEMHKTHYDDLTNILYDPKLIMEKKDREFTRTFCTNPGGRVRLEKLNEDNETFYLINGDANKNSKTENTNFAILTRFYLTEPLIDTRKEGLELVKRVNRYGGGKPLVQKMGDFFDNKRTKKESLLENGLIPTLNNSFVTRGDINLAYSYKVVSKIKEFIHRLDHLVPGVMEKNNLIYAPEIKFYETNYITNNNLETNVENIFVAGDGAGKSRGIIGASLTGIIASRGILKKEGINYFSFSN